ncbi:MAG TPA: S4 domain-containing protein, partial [Rubrivivax sp.]|nr:S4 domain-containing protein [Rubrivivax sp.]
MQLAQILFTQGFGTRRICAGIVAAGRVRIGGQVVDDPHADMATEGLVFEVEGRPWPYREHALLMLHKPAGYECSQKPRHHPSVLSLL